jgi:hypothetical protein
MGFNKRLIDQAGDTGVDFSQEDSFGDGTGIAYWPNPASNLVSQGGGRTISEDVGSLSTYTFSPGGQIALHYNNDRISVNSGVDTNQSYTVSSWIRLGGSGDQAHFFYNLSGSTNNSFAYVVDNGNGTWSMRSRHKFASNDGDTFTFNPSSYTAYTSYYRHFGIVFDKVSGESRYYINGAKVHTGNLDGVAKGTSFNSLMGTTKYQSSFSSYICYMGDIRWYQKALTDDEFLLMAQYDGIP